MKRKLLICVIALCNFHLLQAQETEFGIFNHLAVGVEIGTDGIGFDLSAPVTDYVQLRAGYNFLSGVNYKTDVDYRAKGSKITKRTEVEAKLHMNNAKFLVDLYPFRKATFHATVGAFLGSEEVVTAENTIPVTAFSPGEGIVIGDYIVGFNDDGIARASVKVKKFKPYVGIGFGRAVPRSRFGVSADLGVMFWGNPGVYEKQTGSDQKVTSDDVGGEDDGWIDNISKIGVWPLLTIRFTGRIF
ncbi:MAG: hypothetical protein K5683_08025 [Prevotella sp.]|nr:hypothetical protein [Prevotella sp.]